MSEEAKRNFVRHLVQKGFGMNKERLEWGLQPPEDYTGPAWGARAIFDGGTVPFSLLWDRQSAIGAEDERRALGAMLDDRGLKLLGMAVKANGLRRDEHREVSVEVDGYTIKANPRESCGYLYIVAYRSTP